MRTTDVLRVGPLVLGTSVLLTGCGGATITPPHFRATAGWHVGSQPARTCRIRRGPCVRASGWAASAPCAACGGLEPLQTLASLPPGGALIQLVNFRLGSTHPSRRPWPPRVRGAEVESGHVGETGQPLFYAMEVGRTGADDWSLVVWFGRAHPTVRQLARVNAELRSASP